MKQRFFTIRNHGVLLTVLLVLSLALGTFTDVHVYAEDGDAPAVAEAYDPDAPGSIRVELSDIAGQENVSKDGVELTLYKVGDIHTENHYIQFSLTEELREVESLSGFDLNAITTGEANKEAAGLLETAVREADITPAGVEYTETVTDEAGVSTDGVAVFDGEDGKGLAQGMYLLVQTNANAYGITSSALIAIPYMADGVHWMYDVTVQPKGAAFDSLGSIQVTKALKYDNDGILLDTTAENASYDIGLFMDSQGQYRYGGDIQIEVARIDDEAICRDCMIPRFTLQPLAENAIFHGLEPKGGFGSVLLEICLSPGDGDVLVTLTDDGVGMPPEQVAHLLDPPRTQADAQDKIRHVGLWNVHRRLQYSFGSRYGLTVESEPGVGTAVTIRLPYRRNEGGGQVNAADPTG